MKPVLATIVRKEWSSVCDTVIYDRPQFVKRTRDEFLMLNMPTLDILLESYSFTAQLFIEEDGSITISLDNMDLVENGINYAEAKMKMGFSILEYANEFYENYKTYSVIPNRKSHIPYILRALAINDAEKIGGLIHCRDGQS